MNVKKCLVLSLFLLPIFVGAGLVSQRYLDHRRNTDGWLRATAVSEVPTLVLVGSLRDSKITFCSPQVVTDFQRNEIYSVRNQPGQSEDIYFLALGPEAKFGPRNLRIGIREVLVEQGFSWVGMVYDPVAWTAGMTGKYVPGHSPQNLDPDGLMFVGFRPANGSLALSKK